MYTQYFNQRYKHIGHVFFNRGIRHFYVTNVSYLTALAVYIHQNPIRAKLPEGADYPWSSHKDYVAGGSLLVDIDFILNILHPNRSEAYRRYFDLCKEIQVPQLPPEVSLPDEVHVGREGKQRESSTTNKLTWEEIIIKITRNNVEKEKLLSRCRERRIVAARNRLIYEAINQEVLSRRELAKIL